MFAVIKAGYMQKITPFLWFDGQVEEAINFYTSVFKNARISDVQRMNGQVFTAIFELEGQQFYALNGGPQFKFNESVSFFIRCKDQQEVDYFWDALIAGGGKHSQCGWLKDKFGLSWQVVPEGFEAVMHNPDPVKAKRAMDAMMKMSKLDLAALKAAAEGN
jgi:predicted 3-demethylubiquinone-9 3-methyltransferase (glyoxalase superfamily)